MSMRIILKPDEITDVGYSLEANDRGTMTRTISLVSKKGQHIKIQTSRATRQFLSHIGLKRDQIEKENQPFEDSALHIANALSLRDVHKAPLVFRSFVNPHLKNTYRAWSVVTEEYVELDPNYVQESFEKTLKSLSLGYTVEKTWDSGSAIYVIYNLYKSEKPLKVGNLASAGFMLRIGYSGDRSLGVAAYWKILACSNGMISSKWLAGMRLNHRTSEDILLGRLRRATHRGITDLDRLIPLFNISQTENPKLEKVLWDEVLPRYPKHIQEKLKKVEETIYKDVKGPWRISQCLSDISTHGIDITDNYRQFLAQDAYKVLLKTEEVLVKAK